MAGDRQTELRSTERPAKISARQRTSPRFRYRSSYARRNGTHRCPSGPPTDTTEALIEAGTGNSTPRCTASPLTNPASTRQHETWSHAGRPPATVGPGSPPCTQTTPLPSSIAPYARACPSNRCSAVSRTSPLTLQDQACQRVPRRQPPFGCSRRHSPAAATRSAAGQDNRVPTLWSRRKERARMPRSARRQVQRATRPRKQERSDRASYVAELTQASYPATCRI